MVFQSRSSSHPKQFKLGLFSQVQAGLGSKHQLVPHGGDKEFWPRSFCLKLNDGGEEL